MGAVSEGAECYFCGTPMTLADVSATNWAVYYCEAGHEHSKNLNHQDLKRTPTLKSKG